MPQRKPSFKFLFSSALQNGVRPLLGLSLKAVGLAPRHGLPAMAWLTFGFPHPPPRLCLLSSLPNVGSGKQISWGCARKLSCGLLKRRSKHGVERRGAVRRSERETKRGREATILDKNQEEE